MRIAVYGASGFTGGLALAELRRRGIAAVAVGRDGERLREAADRAGARDADLRIAGLGDHAVLADAFHGCDAVVNCAGPFALWGEPVVRAAIAAGCHYVDTTGEQGYLRHVLDAFDADARRAGVTVVPGLADDGGPGDLIAALVAARLGDVDDLLVADLRRPGAVSRGTARSMAAAGGAAVPLEYRDGGWAAAPADDTGRTIALPGGPEKVAVASFALPGVVTVPRHVRARRVRGAIRTEVAALFGGLTADAVESVPERPDEASRAGARWLMLAEASDRSGRTVRGEVTGTDGYGTTAVIAVEGARRLVADGAPAGTRTPAEAFDPADLLGFLAASGASWRVEDA
ncbi:saccharopine dehydrogenase family protein [Actinomadura violacea]|uniref:Saccharopine dehydrogenase NADP-binding domain-containing protein n=1 Tax=Actinomadura violacea TaxID=2819934 RepID=A0ABS3S2N5_9ACTN|nr:saccharopine dehydrogenase NADP-binding domain-containing protein [Actinomadura violacea]MBO2463271.1 saccharopine dehydrogenase NADP-binding domain-containing protein [Actinomadura violacea]